MDYKDFDASVAKQARKEKQAPDDPGFWFKETEPDKRAQALVAAAAVLKESSKYREQANLRHARMYGNFDVTSFDSRAYHRSASSPLNKMSLNVVASCIDTLASKIAKTKPMPSFLTEGGSYPQQRAAKHLDKFTLGLFNETRVHQFGAKVAFDSLIFDQGCLKIYLEDGRVCVDRVFPGELFVDDMDGVYQKPRQMLQRKLIDKEVLLARYGEDGKVREAISRAMPPANAYEEGFGDCVEVWEAWHLASGKKAKDGLHCIAIDGCELFCEQWKLKTFPFAFLRFSDRVLGFWGQGLAERLAGIQIEINRLLRSVSEQLRRRGRGRMYAPLNSINPKHITNSGPDIVFYKGSVPPTQDNTGVVAREEFEQLDRLYQKAFQEAGISELSAGAKKPSGLDAAVALREFNDIETERFSMFGKAWEQLFMDFTEIALEMLEQEGLSGYKVRAPNRHSYDELTFGDLKYEDDKFIIQMYPVSSLPNTPSAKYQRVKEMLADGFIDMTTAKRLMDFPDIDAENNLSAAASDDVDATISAIIDETPPRYIAPTEVTDLTLLAERSTAAFLRAKHQKEMEPERLQMLETLMDAAKDMLLLSMQPSPGMAPMEGEAAPAPGAPPPQQQNIAGITGGIDVNVNPNGATAPTVPPLIGA